MLVVVRMREGLVVVLVGLNLVIVERNKVYLK